MTNSSATGGYLTPIDIESLYDTAFESFFQEVIVGITGYPATLVRPQGQPVPPQMPPATTDWASFLIQSENDLSVRGQIFHDPTGDGSDVLCRTVQNRILISFYGPNAWAYAGAFCDGLCIEQNRWQLQSASMGIVNFSTRRALYELINEQFLKRVDVEVTMNREIQKTYPVLNLLSAHGTIRANVGDKTLATDFDTESTE
jgi:hypothetical protein